MSKVLIVGGGICGLTVAHYLQKANQDFLLIESADKLGGKVATEQVDGFLLDIGFQVFLTAYPEVQNLFDLNALQLNHFEPGAILRYKGRFVEVNDPFRRPAKLFKSMFSPVGSIKDKLTILKLTQKLKKTTIEDIFKTQETTTLTDLVQLGFSQKMINQFFKPFLGGIFLERKLQTSNRFFRFVLKMFAEGTAALPKGGIQKIIDQLAAAIPNEKIVLNQKVTDIKDGELILEDGSSMKADHIILTCPHNAFESIERRTYNPVCNLYFSAPAAPVKGANLILNGEGSGLINNVVFVSEIDKTVTPKDKTLVSVSVIGNPNLSDEQLIEAVSDELNDWFGMTSKSWKPIKLYRIEHALPLSTKIKDAIQPFQTNDTTLIAGQHIHYGSLNAAIKSGRKAAEWVLDKN